MKPTEDWTRRRSPDCSHWHLHLGSQEMRATLPASRLCCYKVNVVLMCIWRCRTMVTQIVTQSVQNFCLHSSVRDQREDSCVDRCDKTMQVAVNWVPFSAHSNKYSQQLCKLCKNQEITQGKQKKWPRKSCRRIASEVEVLSKYVAVKNKFESYSRAVFKYGQQSWRAKLPRAAALLIRGLVLLTREHGGERNCLTREHRQRRE